MLNYIDNYNYSLSGREDIDRELRELNLQAQQGYADYDLYKSIRNYVYKEIKVEQLAITKILGDLIEIRQHSEHCFNVLLAFLANPFISYSDLGLQWGISKQRVHEILNQYGNQCPWLKNLLEIKGIEDAKNQVQGKAGESVKKDEKNRQIRGKKGDFFQPCLFW